jgi:hypothetical protein
MPDQSNNHQNPENSPSIPEKIEAALENGTFAGTFFLRQSDPSEETTQIDGEAIYAGRIIDTEIGGVLVPDFDQVQIEALGIKNHDDINRAIKSDSGSADLSSVSIGYNRRYASNFDKAFGPSDN